MNRKIIHIPVRTDALNHAARCLGKAGFLLTDFPDEADCILLPIPTPDSLNLPPARNVPVLGGKLNGRFPAGSDLLEDPRYLAANANITAEAALGILLTKISTSFARTPVLVLGWGRIGKCLSRMLQRLGFPVAVAAHQQQEQAIAEALGYELFDAGQISTYRAIINTADVPILSGSDAGCIHPDCILLDLASHRQLPGDRVIHARGLPGMCRPEASGALIAQFVTEYLEKGMF